MARGPWAAPPSNVGCLEITECTVAAMSATLNSSVRLSVATSARLLLALSDL